MKTKSFAFATLRILSIWILAKYILLNLFTMVSGIFQYFQNPNDQFNSPNYTFLLPLFLFVFWSIISWFLWFKAEKLSNKLILSEVSENNIEKYDSEKILNVALTILGFYFVFQSIPDLISNLIYTYNYYSLIQELDKIKNIISIVKPLITLIIGLLCIMQTENIKRLINKLQKIGLEKRSS